MFSGSGFVPLISMLKSCRIYSGVGLSVLSYISFIILSYLSNFLLIDEAHNLRNVYSKSNTMAKNILEGVIDKKKVLLTATPFQNSLMELYGITRYINNDLFGDPSYFKYKYIVKN